MRRLSDVFQEDGWRDKESVAVVVDVLWLTGDC